MRSRPTRPALHGWKSDSFGSGESSGSTACRAFLCKRLAQLSCDETANHLPRAAGKAENLVLSWDDRGHLPQAAGQALPATMASLT